MKIYIFIIAATLIGLLIGFLIGRLTTPKKSDGTIFLEKNEEGIDRIRFYLNMEYDDISKYSRIVFNVKKNS